MKIIREARVLQDLKHDNIIGFKDLLQTKNRLYVITQYAHAGNLKEFIKKKK